MEHGDGVEDAIRAHLNSPLPDLIHEVVVLPVQVRCSLANGVSVELALAREGGVACGALDGHAVGWIRAVPHDAPRPRLEEVLRDDSHRDSSRRAAGAKVSDGGVTQTQPTLYPG